MVKEGEMSLPRLLYYPVTYQECGANEARALELVPLKDEEWFVVERDELHDLFKIWHIIGEYH